MTVERPSISCASTCTPPTRLSDAGVRRFIHRVGPANIEHLFALRHADIAGSGLPKRDGDNEAFEARVAQNSRGSRHFRSATLPSAATT